MEQDSGIHCGRIPQIGTGRLSEMRVRSGSKRVTLEALPAEGFQ